MRGILYLFLLRHQEAGPLASRTAPSAADIATAADEVHSPRAPADPAALASAFGQRRCVLFRVGAVWWFRFAQQRPHIRCFGLRVFRLRTRRRECERPPGARVDVTCLLFTTSSSITRSCSWSASIPACARARWATTSPDGAIPS